MEKTAKDAVIEALLCETGLEIRELYAKTRNAGSPFGYHSIYKAASLLHESGILSKRDRKFILSHDWTAGKIEFAKKLKEHKQRMEGGLCGPDSTSILEFDNIRELYRFLRKFEQENLAIFDSKPNSSVIWFVFHCYNFLLQPEMEISYIRRVIESRKAFHILCYGDTYLDSWTKKTYEKLGAVMKTGASLGGVSEINVYDNFAIEIFYDKNFRHVLDSIYSGVDDFSKLDMSTVFEKLSAVSYKAYIAIISQPKIVESLKASALELFKGMDQ